MKSLCLVPFLVLLLACSSEQKAAPTTSAPSAAPATSAPVTAPAASTVVTPRPGRKEGEMCGGIAGLRCDEGLECVIPEPMHPDKSGKCQKR